MIRRNEKNFATDPISSEECIHSHSFVGCFFISLFLLSINFSFHAFFLFSLILISGKTFCHNRVYHLFYNVSIIFGFLVVLYLLSPYRYDFIFVFHFIDFPEWRWLDIWSLFLFQKNVVKSFVCIVVFNFRPSGLSHSVCVCRLSGRTSNEWRLTSGRLSSLSSWSKLSISLTIYTCGCAFLEHSIYHFKFYYGFCCCCCCVLSYLISYPPHRLLLLSVLFWNFQAENAISTTANTGSIFQCDP